TAPNDRRPGLPPRPQASSSGAARSTPEASPSHQVSHSSPSESRGARSKNARLMTPSVGLIRLAPMPAMATNPAASRALDAGEDARVARRNRLTARTACRAAPRPKAVPHARLGSDVSPASSAGVLPSNDPSHTAGQKRVPQPSRAATATPEAGK